MRLSDYKNEEALDVLADLMEPAAEILADPEAKRIYENKEPKIKLAGYIVKNHKKAIITILAILDGEDPEKYSFTLLQVPAKIIELLNDPELMNLFTQQGQTSE